MILPPRWSCHDDVRIKNTPDPSQGMSGGSANARVSAGGEAGIVSGAGGETTSPPTEEDDAIKAVITMPLPSRRHLRLIVVLPPRPSLQR